METARRPVVARVWVEGIMADFPREGENTLCHPSDECMSIRTSPQNGHQRDPGLSWPWGAYSVPAQGPGWTAGSLRGLHVLGYM